MPHMTVLDKAAFGLLARGEPKDQAYATARHWLKAVGLEDRDGAYPAELSGGMKQRVGLARALATGTDTLLMDEAFSALDPLIRADMQDLLLDLHRRSKTTVVFVTHDLAEAVRIGDRIAILRAGEVVQAGTPSDIIDHPADDYVARFVSVAGLRKPA
jgi:glycine betaine/proline transport system ATP-binding protein